MKTKFKLFILIFGALSMMSQCLAQTPSERTYVSNNDKVLGFEFMKKIPGLWNGPVSSATSAGSFTSWYVDFRPISSAQVSQFSMLDSNTVNNMSFFIVKDNNKLKVALRTEGCFKDKCCVTYEVMDSVNDAKGYYRFSDVVSGVKRAFTEFVFQDEQFVMKVYTTKFNKVNPLELHSTFTAKLATREYASQTGVRFNYPQPVMIKDFSDEFKNMKESIFFSFENDPYKSEAQPYVGSASIHISINPEFDTKNSDEICVLLTTEPLFEGIQYLKENLKFISKYVYLPYGTTNYTLKNVHPGKYYIYTFLDRDKDKKHGKGDYMSSNTIQSFIVTDKGDATVNALIDFVIP